ncbi:hypothetical protein ACIRJO_27400 [Streptomyces sp. NPDC102394]|uniref:hypothetical protein n=1 Tax=Streptomyces sp. NPDC102394 TaxID=3366167 RepID=UPI00381D1A38
MSSAQIDAPGQSPSPEWTDAAKRDPNGLTALIAGQYMELHRRIAESRDRIAFLNGIDAAVRADLSHGTLSSPSRTALRLAHVPLTALHAAIQQGIRSGQWSLGRPGSPGTLPPQLEGAFRETAADWQRALADANSAFEESVRQAQTAFDDHEPYADAMRPGENSWLAPLAFPQDTYVGANPAGNPDQSSGGRASCRWLMRRQVLPHRSWASLPWLDFGTTNLVFVPDGQSLSYAAAMAAARGIVADQMSRAAPDCLKITWIDALHSGRGAGAFLRLAESGSRIIDGQVWTDPPGIESALQRVADRMAGIERTCLKNEFDDLDAYNAQSGLPPEAHHVVVVSGYPVGLRETSAQLLRQITGNGDRAGICVIIVMDASMASMIGTTDAIAPSYAQLADGPGPANAPDWWSPAVLPLGEFVLGHSGRPYARVVTAPEHESLWVPCELQSVDEAVQTAIIRGYARASHRLAESGMSPRELDIKRIDPIARTVSLRSAMISWLHEREAADRHPEGWDDFVQSDAPRRTGITYTFAEVAKQAAYLCDQGYTAAGPDDAPDLTGLSFPRLTSKGGDMALSGSTGAGDFAANSGKSGNATTNHYNGPVFQGDMSRAQIAWNNRDVTQSRSSVEQVTPGFEELAQAVTRTLAQLPLIGLPDEDAEDAAASANEILGEVVSPTPDRGRIRRSLTALRSYLQPVAAQAALGTGEGAHDLAKAALDHLQGAVF